MRSGLLAFALLLGAAAPAAASEWISCTGEGVGIDLLMGQLSVAAVTRANFSIGEDRWSTHPDLEPGTLITLGQAFETPSMLLVDLTDDSVNDIVAELRLAKAEEGRDFALAGTLRIPGRGAWAVTCSGP